LSTQYIIYAGGKTREILYAYILSKDNYRYIFNKNFKHMQIR